MSCSGCSSPSPSQAQQAALSYQIQMSIQAKTLAAARQQGAAVAQLLEGALNLAKEPGQGEGLDVQA